MHNFSTLLLRSYYDAIGFNEDNLYSNLTRSSAAVLDFAIPPSLSLQLSNAPTPTFFSSYALDAFPQLNGSVSYITSSQPVENIFPSISVPLKTMVEHFHAHPVPIQPPLPDEIYQAGELITPPRDFLLYSRLHLPSLHLSALATTKITPALQAHVAFLHQPALAIQPKSSSTAAAQGNGPPSPLPAPPPPPGNFLISLQQDTAKWSSEYTYSAQDGMLGFRGLYNFGMSKNPGPPPAAAATPSRAEEKVSTHAAMAVLPMTSGKESEDVREAEAERLRVDEQETMEGGLRGRFSAGGELYFSYQQRSLGVSIGTRFTTFPATPSNPNASPPTTLTILYNPLIGYLSTAYSAQVSPHLCLSSRYGINLYSYESDLTMGGEWWIGSGRGRGGWRGLRDRDREADGEVAMPVGEELLVKSEDSTDRDGVLKGRVSGAGLLSVLYESRIRRCLLSVGVTSDMGSRRSNPITSMGLELQYFSE